MVSKGLDFAHVHVVGIMNADTMLNFPDFRAYERSYQLMAQVAGRAGRRDSRGLVILQTRNVDIPVIHQVTTNNYDGLYAEQVAERELFRYPPFCRLIYVYLRGRDEQAVVRAAEAMAQGMRGYFAHRVLGPESPAVARVHSLHIRKLMLKAESALGVTQVRRYLYEVQQELSRQGLLHGVMLYYDVDPY
jgi:primosomal protein N' (replication factor Y)